jgi:hypothetical protein
VKSEKSKNQHEQTKQTIRRKTGLMATRRKSTKADGECEVLPPEQATTLGRWVDANLLRTVARGYREQVAPTWLPEILDELMADASSGLMETIVAPLYDLDRRIVFGIFEEVGSHLMARGFVCEMLQTNSGHRYAPSETYALKVSWRHAGGPR